MKIQGKTVLITGGCSGIGKIMARRAVELDLGYRGINFPSHFIRLMQGIFPHSWFNFLFGDVCGLYTVMDHFTGRRK